MKAGNRAEKKNVKIPKLVYCRDMSLASKKKKKYGKFLAL